MGRFKDLTGETFGRLTVLERAEDYVSPKRHTLIKWLCQCSCGNVVIITGCQLKTGKTQSCGCLQKERTILSHKKYNDYEVQEDYVIMYTQKGEPFFVDLEDFWKVRDICWHIDKDGYVCGTANNKNVFLHRYIMLPSDCMDVDHIHGEKSRNDNRKSNLRIATSSQNNMNKRLQSNNTSGVTGVDWQKKHSTWRARITINHHTINLGDFINFDDAVKVRKEAEEKYFGEYSYDNSQRGKGE